jgi:aspartate kinase
MLVVKFGGTSVGKPERMKKIANLVLSMPGKKIVVLSALSGTTNTLVKIGDYLLGRKQSEALTEIAALEKHYTGFIEELYAAASALAAGKEIVKLHFDLLRSLTSAPFDDRGYREILAQGELLSTQLFFQHLQERNVSSALLAALDFMSIDENHEPELGGNPRNARIHLP